MMITIIIISSSILLFLIIVVVVVVLVMMMMMMMMMSNILSRKRDRSQETLLTLQRKTLVEREGRGWGRQCTDICICGHFL